MVAPFFSGNLYGIVASDEDDRSVLVSCLAAAVIGRTEFEKLAACCYCATPAMVFWAIFWRLWASSVEIIGLDLFVVLRRVRWKCLCSRR